MTLQSMPEILNSKLAPPVLLILVSSHDGDFVPNLVSVLARGLVVAVLVTPEEPYLSLSQSESMFVAVSNPHFTSLTMILFSIGKKRMPSTYLGCHAHHMRIFVFLGILGCCQGNNRKVSLRGYSRDYHNGLNSIQVRVPSRG